MAAIIILIALGFIVMSQYNKLVGLREMVKNSMGQIAAQVESRWDALSSLISATKKYSEHESEVLENITKSRAGINNNSNASDVERDSQIFEEAVRKINIVAESYPDLKASNVYENTMNQIDKYENNVRHSRMIFNDTVTKYNRSILSFPTSIIANLFGFREEEYFKASEDKKDMPTWD